MLPICSGVNKKSGNHSRGRKPIMHVVEPRLWIQAKFLMCMIRALVWSHFQTNPNTPTHPALIVIIAAFPPRTVVPLGTSHNVHIEHIKNRKLLTELTLVSEVSEEVIRKDWGS